MRYLREALNTFALFLLFTALISLFYVLRDARFGHDANWTAAIYSGVAALPYLGLLATGRMFTAAFFTELIFGGSKAAERGYSKERAWARGGRGHDAAFGLLLRDRIVGDIPGLWTVLEMARLDPSMTQEAAQAATRLIGSRRISSADRAHAGRMLQQAKISVARQVYPGSR